MSNLVLQCKEGIGNLTFDSWYPSTKLMSLLTVMDIPAICTVRDNGIGEVQIKSKSSMSKLERRAFSYAYDDVAGFHCVQWNDNSVVITLSNCISTYRLDRVERFLRNEKKKKRIPVARPNLIKVYTRTFNKKE